MPHVHQSVTVNLASWWWLSSKLDSDIVTFTSPQRKYSCVTMQNKSHLSWEMHWNTPCGQNLCDKTVTWSFYLQSEHSTTFLDRHTNKFYQQFLTKGRLFAISALTELYHGNNIWFIYFEEWFSQASAASLCWSETFKDAKLLLLLLPATSLFLIFQAAAII